MKIFKKKSTQKVSSGEAAVFSASRSHDVYEPFDSSMEHWEKELYDRLRFTVPVIDAAISKIFRGNTSWTYRTFYSKLYRQLS